MSLATNVSALATRIATEFKTIRTMMTGTATGDLTSLTTTNKTSLIAAINETKAGNSGSPPDASEITKGIAELATQAEVTAGTDDLRIVTPLKLATRLASITVADATETVKGIVELATTTEVTTGTDTTRAVTPAGVKAATDAVKTAILGAGVPAALDTLDELAAALGDDANYAATVTTALSNKQPLDADLTAIAALVSAANKVPYATGANTWALADFTAAGRSVVGAADLAAIQTYLNVYTKTEMGDPTTDFAAVFVAALV